MVWEGEASDRGRDCVGLLGEEAWNQEGNIHL